MIGRATRASPACTTRSEGRARRSRPSPWPAAASGAWRRCSRSCAAWSSACEPKPTTN